MPRFTDEELLAYADECLSSERCSSIEQALRSDSSLMESLITLLSERDQGAHTIGDMWRRLRLSCPPRAVWGAYVEGRLGDRLSQYLRFHVETIGCRICSANLADLERPASKESADRRTQKIFQSSAGRLRGS